MAIWAGLGVNYKSQSQANVAADITFFRAIGLRYIRVHIPAPDDNGKDTWRAIAKQFHDAGFYVIWGIAKWGLTSAQWSAHHDAVVTEAAYCQQNGVCDEFQIGNEMDSSAHLDASITAATMRTNLLQLATDVKAVVTTMKISYSFAAPANTTAWTALGKGDLDYMGMNIYDNWNTNEAYWSAWYKAPVNQMNSAFGSAWRITEWNVDGNHTKFLALLESQKEQKVEEMQAYFKLKSVPFACFFSWRSYLDDDNGSETFNVKYSDGAYRTSANPLLTNGGRRAIVE